MTTAQDYAKRYQKTEKYRTYRNKVNRSLPQIFRVRRATAIRRGISWTLTLEEFLSLRVGACVYCAGVLPEAGIGLDRIDNAKGYEKENLVPCCATCNYVRGDRFSSEEMTLFLGPAVKQAINARATSVASPSLYQQVFPL